jgi:hypothetical protein
MTTSTHQTNHKWRFFRSGGFDQVRIDSGNDIIQLDKLDQKLWVALSCPVEGIEFNEITLKYLDSDHDGKIRVLEVLGVIKWLSSVFKNLNSLVGASDIITLDNINKDSEIGKQIAASAQLVCKVIGKTDATTLSVEQIDTVHHNMVNANQNGDGIIPVGIVADDTELDDLINGIIKCVGGISGVDGRIGVNRELLQDFLQEAKDYLAWNDLGDKGVGKVAKFTDTEKSYQAYELIKAKVDDYFIRCGLAAFHIKAEEALAPNDSIYQSLNGKDLYAGDLELEKLPLALIKAGGKLPLGEGINPLWIDRINLFKELVIIPLFGNRSELTAEDWNSVKATFNDFITWKADIKGERVTALGGAAEVRKLVIGRAKERLLTLIEEDEAITPQVEALGLLEKAVYLHRDLHTFLVNFVSFRDFYTGQGKAIFQAGTLYLDGRSCDLCIKVKDPETHSKLASLSNFYIAYCKCVRREDGNEIYIAATFTDGDASNLIIGRNGVFYDRKGCDWDATIIKIVEQPISVREAFWRPYKRLGRFISEQIEKFASAREQANEAATTTTASTVATATVKGDTKAAVQPFDVGKFAGIFAALGLAVGALGTALASILTGFLALVWWQMPLAIIGIVLFVSGPSMLIAYLKLSQRNLAPLLDANGWAINTKAKINLLLGQTFTGMPQLPKGSERTLKDPYAENGRPWKLYIFTIVTIGLIIYLFAQGIISIKMIQELFK